MAYIDLTYYKTTYGGYNPGTDALIQTAINRAEDLVDIQTGFSIPYTTLETWQDTILKKAVAAQTEFYLQNGEGYNDSGSDSESIGAYSYSGKGQSGGDRLSPRAKSFLVQTNLMNRSVHKIPNLISQEEILE